MGADDVKWGPPVGAPPFQGYPAPTWTDIQRRKAKPKKKPQAAVEEEDRRSLPNRLADAYRDPLG